ncbi:ParB N-terminal domain-containing protein [Flexithrix dorotheae]|uniref:N-6 DNA methylase n=1 Tax=Flexithrix dorotheae TaxID=70993 RepID=UPI003CCBD197
MVSLEQILLLKGFILVGNDFLLYTPEAGKAPDKIIMNPPFENNQDIAHLQHAYSILKPGGRVVAIIGEGAFFRQGKKETAFRDWLHQIDGVEEPLPENSFKGAEAFKQTGVRSRLVIIDKPGAEKEDDLSLALALQKQRIRILKLKAKLKSGLGNINDDVKLKLQLQKQRIRLLKLKSKKSNAQTKVQAVPLSKIHVNKKLFQNRETDYSHESVQRILEAVESGNFRWEVFDPVLLWKSPAGKLYILSGHSRTQAFKELVKKRKKVGGKSFKSIPAKIIQVSETEAKRIALESNTLSTKETDTERANYYRSLRNQKKSKKEVVELAQKNEGKNWKKIFNLSYLNPEGFLIDSIKATENSDVQSKSVVNTIADWIGELRVRFPELTDSHEKEIADWLMGDAYGNKTGQISNKRMFLEKLESAIYKITEFGKIPPGKRLNLKKTVSKSPVEQDYERQVEALKREKKKAMDVLKEKTEKLLKGAHEGKITKKKAQELLEPYQDNYMGLFNKLNKLLGKKYDIAQAAKQQTSLFGLGKFLIQNKKELLKAPI